MFLGHNLLFLMQFFSYSYFRIKFGLTFISSAWKGQEPPWHRIHVRGVCRAKGGPQSGRPIRKGHFRDKKEKATLLYALMPAQLV